MSRPAAKPTAPDSKEFSAISNQALIKHWVPAIKRMESTRNQDGSDRQTPYFWGAGRIAVEILWRWESGWIEDSEESRRVVAIMRDRLLAPLSTREKEILLRRSRNQSPTEAR